MRPVCWVLDQYRTQEKGLDRAEGLTFIMSATSRSTQTPSVTGRFACEVGFGSSNVVGEGMVEAACCRLEEGGVFWRHMRRG